MEHRGKLQLVTTVGATEWHWIYFFVMLVTFEYGKNYLIWVYSKWKKQQNSTCRAVHECRQISQSVLPGWDRASTVVPADRAFAVVQRASIDPGWNHWWTLLPCSSPAPSGPLSPLVSSVTDQVKFNGWHRQTDNTKAVHSFVHFIYRNTQ